MKYDPNQHHRRSVRLRGYDYSQQGAYFVTICTQQKYLHFDDDRFRAIAETCWLDVPRHFPTVELDEWVLMPNHLHGIIVMTGEAVGGLRGGEQRAGGARRGVQLNAPTKNPTATRNTADKFSSMSPFRNTLSVIVRTYKAAVTTQSHRAGLIEFAWQRGFYEHVIRDEHDLNRIRQYIVENPATWAQDEYYRNWT